MITPINKLLADFSGNSGCHENTICAAEKALGKYLPMDYKNFLAFANGGEGFFGKHYLIAWKVEELDQFNREYQVPEFAPGLILFGSNGGGEGFAFDTTSTPFRIVQVPFIGMSFECAVSVADSFIGLLERMIQTDESLL